MDFFVDCLLDYFSSIVFLWYPGVRLKIAFCQLCIPLCGRFGHDKGGVADYVDRVWSKYAAKWDMLCLGANRRSRFSNKPVLLFFYGLFFMEYI